MKTADLNDRLLSLIAELKALNAELERRRIESWDLMFEFFRNARKSSPGVGLSAAASGSVRARDGGHLIPVRVTTAIPGRSLGSPPLSGRAVTDEGGEIEVRNDRISSASIPVGSLILVAFEDGHYRPMLGVIATEAEQGGSVPPSFRPNV